MARKKQDEALEAAEIATEAAPLVVIQSVARGGRPPPEAEASTMTLDEYVRTLGPRARIAGFVQQTQGRQPLRRSAADWQAAMAAHQRRPVR